MTLDLVYSIAVPVFNNAATLPELCSRIIATLKEHTFEIILVDDGSTDHSWSVISQLKAQHAGIVRGIRLQKNFGQHAATLCAFSYSIGNYVITIDADLQHAPEDITLLIETENKTGTDIVYAALTNKQTSLLRQAGSLSVSTVAGISHSNRASVKQGSSFRLIRKWLVTAIAENHRHNFIYIDELLRWYTDAIAYVPVLHHSRKEGHSSYRLPALFRLALNLLTNYSSLPLKGMIYIGALFSCIFFLTGIYYLALKFLYDVPMGYTSLIVAVLFSASMIMLCLGIISLYLFKMYLFQQRKPVFHIREQI